MQKFRVDDPSIPRPLFITVGDNSTEEERLEAYNTVRQKIETAQRSLFDYRKRRELTPSGRRKEVSNKDV